MKLKRLILLLVILPTFGFVGRSQSIPSVVVDGILEKPRVLAPHLLVFIDRVVTFKLMNNTKSPVVVFGSEVEGKLEPVRYRLWNNKKLNAWEYPTRLGKAIPWKEVSSTYKKERRLQPGEELHFYGYFSSESDCDQTYRVTVQIRIGKSKKTQEIVSEDISLGPCKTPPN